MHSNELIIRRTESGDLKNILELVQKTIRRSYADFYPKEALDYFLIYHSLESLHSDFETSYMLTAVQNDSIIGTGTLSGGTIKRVFIHPDVQRTGCGKQIMEVIEHKAKKMHLEYLELHASLPSKAFYDNRAYKTQKYCKLPVENNLTLDYYHMGKMLRTVKHPPVVNLNDKTFFVIRNDGPDTEVTDETSFTFTQVDELVTAEYHGGMVENGQLTGYMDGAMMVFHFDQIDTSGQRNSGNSIDAVEILKNGKIRLIDRWKWETKRGEGYCILETND